MKTKRLVFDGLLATVALTIFMLEAQVPVPIPVPGVKLGLANIITLCAVFAIGPWDALGILLCRTVLGAFFAGQMMTLIYSLSGGLLCWVLCCMLRRIMDDGQVWLCSILGAMGHNIGQIAAAIAVTQTPKLLVYLPVLMVSGIISGAFTGLAARFMLKRMKDIIR